MKDKLEIGMYVRTKYGIGMVDETEMFMDKYFQFHLDSNKGRIHNVTTNTYWNSEEDIIGEPSFKIIDVIEEGDLVNDMFVESNEGNKLCTLEEDYERSTLGYVRYVEIFNGQIETVVTHEQLAAMSYEVKYD